MFEGWDERARAEKDFGGEPLVEVTIGGPRGFAAWTPEQRRAAAVMGGKAAHAMGRAHEFTPGEAKIAGRKGGAATRVKRAGA
jgi:general stress protein YciG